MNGEDGVFNLSYEQIIASSDLTIFPSFYEPWGYTPLESIAYSTPTITTDLAGFGDWVSAVTRQNFSNAVFVLKRRENKKQKVIAALNKHLLTEIKKCHDKIYVAGVRKEALEVAYLADWKNFYQGYLEAYQETLQKKW